MKSLARGELDNSWRFYTGSAINVTASTKPPGLTVNLTYNGSPNTPTNVGRYTVVGVISDPNYYGSITGTLVIDPNATVTLSNLFQRYSGSAISVTAGTTPPGLTVNLTYNGSPNTPTDAAVTPSSASSAIRITTASPQHAGGGAAAAKFYRRQRQRAAIDPATDRHAQLPLHFGMGHQSDAAGCLAAHPHQLRGHERELEFPSRICRAFPPAFTASARSDYFQEVAADVRRLFIFRFPIVESEPRYLGCYMASRHNATGSFANFMLEFFRRIPIIRFK